MPYWCSHSVICNLYQIVKNYGIWKISSFYCYIRLVVSLALPLLLLPVTCGTRMVFLQLNVSQCVQIWIINISNTDLFTQTIYLWYKYYSKWICVTFSFQYMYWVLHGGRAHFTGAHTVLLLRLHVPFGQTIAKRKVEKSLTPLYGLA